MNKMTLRWCNFSGVAFLVMWLVGFLFFARVVPPPSPDASATQVAQFFAQHTGGIRFGIMLTLFVSPLYASWSAAIAAQMKRMPGVYPVLADLQLVLGGLTVLVFMIPALLLEVAAFRPDRAPGAIQTLDDIAWMMFIGMGATAILQPAIIAVAIFQDRGENPVLPRWVGYLNVWTVLLFLPGPFCVFFKTGPLAWDGVFPWWIPFVVFALWMLVMIIVLHRSINRYEGSPITSAAVDAEISQRITEIVDAKIDALRLELTRTDRSA
ncbi:hypothetical protein ORI20_28885 [Mycobacterium sp. CVI_P3]|uniref:DUF4386 domain-containing protein n=1 Tax=Mycobacterium pinniadriaticum TaxID=2994102 RepID=A0ABT3SP90_9MYCO|nr:hypothetical protein [Mycobacterium pinniadriaticum]MCX2934287.1 hypothetical protein [Mycobacterium pinniadriaticum]MCX2940675.1 hypothetical protein [Mycobacterium pinniadriaticum]